MLKIPIRLKSPKGPSKIKLKSSYLERQKLIGELLALEPQKRGHSQKLKALREQLLVEHQNICFGALCKGQIHSLELFRKKCNTCKKCHNKIKKDSYNKNNGNIYQRYRYLLKYGKSCEICGCSDPILLDFDHLDQNNKTSDISQISNLRKLSDEVTKTRILCVFCHRLHTQYQLGFTNANPKRKFINESKLSIGKCQLCNKKVTPETTCCFDFDHIIPANKLLSVSQMASNNYSIDKIKNEIGKCQLLCCLCHRKKTAQQLNYPEHHKIKIKLKKQINKCTDCGIEIDKSAIRCVSCNSINNRIIKNRPSLEQINLDYDNLKSWIKVGKKYNVSDNVIRKWIKAYNKVI